jgi:membrane protease YdiL (CAAX protease family)
MNDEKISPAEVFRNALIFFGMFFLVICGFQFIPLMYIKNNSSILTNIISTIAYFLIYGVLIWIAIACYKRYGRHSIKQKFGGYEFKNAIIFYGISIVLEVILSFANMLIYNQTDSANQKAINEMMNNNNFTLVLMLFGVVILSPILEELVFRGILMDTVFQPTAKWLPIIVSGGLFSLGHAPGFNIFFILIYFEMGFFMAYVYKKTGNIKVDIVMHMINNLISSLGIVVMIFQK